MNTKKLLYALSAALVLLCASCIKNNIPYPRIQVNFRSFEVEGQTRAAAIDSATRVLTVYIGESVDPYNVHVTSYTLTPGGSIIDNPLDRPVDLSRDMILTLSLYQDYQWVIRAEQQISRYFNVDGQIGSSLIDPVGHRVIVQMPTTADVSALRVTSAKLGPDGAVMDPDLTAGGTIDASQPVSIKVSAFGRTDVWTVYVELTEATVSTLSADGWTRVGWVYGQAMADADFGVEYRMKGVAEWTRCPRNWLTVNGGDFHARITGLLPMTTYEARAFSGDEYGATLEFTTGQDVQVPNSMLTDWWKDGKVWCPWPQDGPQVWDTGNKGATTLGDSNSTPTDDTSSGTGMAARLETRFVGIGPLGKLAAGNIFVGKYVRTDGTNGVLSLGYKFTERPTRLTGYYKYHSAPISSTTEGFAQLVGRPDTCIVWVALIDSDQPVEIRTNPKNRQLFDPAAADVVAYGTLECGKDVEGYTRFDIQLDYRATNREPKYILITASASKYGDYFTGGNGSLLYIDDLQLLYDY